MLNIFSSAGASILAVGLFLPAIYFVHAFFRGKPAGDNPWLLPGLEWRTSSPPPTFNFDETPIVTWEAYEFGEENNLFEEVAATDTETIDTLQPKGA